MTTDARTFQADDGGSAFPRGEIHDQHEWVGLGVGGRRHLPAEEGMTLRDYFAAHFMSRAQSLCENAGEWNMQNAAQCAYQMADEMLAARSAS